MSPASSAGGDSGAPYRVTLSSSAVRTLRDISPRIAHALVNFAFTGLAESPRRRGKPLGAEFAGLWSARRGEYRVIYEIDDEVHVLVVIHISHRADAYRPQ